MTLIDESYFVGEIYLAQLGQTVGNSAYLALITNKYEPIFLIDVFGYELQKLMLANPSLPKYAAIIDGSEYTYNGRLYKWNGLVNTNKQSPIAQFVYYWFVRSKVEQQVGAGTVKPKTENSTVFNPEYSMIKSWNDMCKMLESLWFFMQANKADYPEFDTNCIRKFSQFDDVNNFF